MTDVKDPGKESRVRLWLIVTVCILTTVLVSLVASIGFHADPRYKEWGTILLVPALYTIVTFGIERWKFLRSTDSFLVQAEKVQGDQALAMEKAVERSITAQEPKVNDKFKEELEKFGSIYFTGVMRQYRSGNVFGDIAVRPNGLEQDLRAYGDSKILFIGMGQRLLPKFVFEDMRNHHKGKPAANRYLILHSAADMVVKARFQSILDGLYDAENEEQYRTLNKVSLAEFRQLLSLGDGPARPNDVVQLVEHSVYPFGSMVAHGNLIWYSPLWNHRNSKTDGAALEVRRDSQLGRELIGSFDAIWNKSAPEELRINSEA